jgi:putative nucleotidyltransferase with HDIG domain
MVNVRTSINEWNFLRQDVRACSATVSRNEWEVLEGINTYRMVLSGVSFKPLKVDQEIWESYRRLNERIPNLTKRTKKGPLVLKSRKSLAEIQMAWHEILTEQKRLLETLEKAPKSTEFYNRIHLARIKKNEQDLRDAELTNRNAQAREAIEKAMGALGQDGEHNSSTQGSTILKLDDARQYWNTRLREISDLENNSRVDADEVLSVFRNLEQVIREAPSMAERVKEVEVLFIRLMTMQEELSGHGKNIIPAEQLSNMLILVQDEIPRLWASGDWDRLQQALKQVANFVKFYEMPVRSELSVAERRKPGLTRALLMGANNLPISQATPLIRSLVTAIDARDRYMRGHSDMVARVAVQIGKRLNWTGEDLDMLEIAGLLHDVGKIVIPEQVLTKLDPLTPEEWKTIQMHPYHGARIVKSLDSLNRIIPWIYHHQERWDGAGYPDGLSQGTIPAAARIIGVTEAFTVMVTDQPKRKALTTDDAITEVEKQAGTQFDPEVAEAFVDAVVQMGPSLIKPLPQSQPLKLQ